MKIFCTILAAITLGYSIQAQMPAAPTSDAAALEAIKAGNAALIEQQAATLATLEELKETAKQVKIFSRRA